MSDAKWRWQRDGYLVHLTVVGDFGYIETACGFDGLETNWTEDDGSRSKCGICRDNEGSDGGDWFRD